MLNFFKKLLPNVEKRRLLSQVNNIKESIDNILRPSLMSVVDTYNELGIKTTTSVRAKRFEKDFNNQIKNLPELKAFYRVYYATMILGVAENMSRKLEALRIYVEKNFVDNLITDATTFKQLHVIRLIDLARFWFNYTMYFLHQSEYEECQNAGVKALSKPLVDAQLKFLEESYASYIRISAIFSQKDVEFIKIIEQTSDLIVSEAESNIAILGAAADPNKLGFAPVIGDAILFVREWSFQKEGDAYEANKLRLQTLQLQLEALRAQAQGEYPNPAVIKQIEYQMNRIRQLEYSVRQFEEKAGVYNGRVI